MKKLLPLLLAAMLLLTACQGGAPAGGETPAESGRPQQEETGAGSQVQEDGGQAQTGETNAGAQSPQPEETGPAEEPEETGSGPVSGEGTGGQTRPAGQALSAQAMSALEKITYYGDRSRCAMSREQLAAYGQLALTYDENDEGNGGSSTSYAFLADFDGNGDPYLVFVHPAPGMGAYAPEVYAYVDGHVQIVCSCWDGSASGGYLEELNDGRVLYVEWETLDDSGYYDNVAYDYSQISGGDLIPADEPAEDDGESGEYHKKPASGNDAYGEIVYSLYELCYPGWNGSEICSSTDEATAALLLAAKGNAASDREQMAAAMVDLLLSADPYGGLEGFLQAKLVDLDQDGVEEMFVMEMDQGMLYSWQGGALQGKSVGITAGGSVDWYLCRDAETGELGIECESIGGGDFSGGSRTYYYADDRTVEISDINKNYTVDGAPATQAQYDAVVARHQRQEVLNNGYSTDQETMQATVDALLAILAQ